MSLDGEADSAHGGPQRDQEQKLVYMANQIGMFFGSRPDEEAIAEIAGHIRKFWDPRMRLKIIAHVKSGVGGLQARPRAAIVQLMDDSQR